MLHVRNPRKLPQFHPLRWRFGNCYVSAGPGPGLRIIKKTLQFPACKALFYKNVGPSRLAQVTSASANQSCNLPSSAENAQKNPATKHQFQLGSRGFHMFQSMLKLVTCLPILHLEIPTKKRQNFENLPAPDGWPFATISCTESAIMYHDNYELWTIVGTEEIIL